MRVTPRVLEAKNTEGCRIWLRFADGIAAEVDFSYLLDYEGIFLPLRDPELFRQVRVSETGATIEWPDEVDVAPETVYARTREAADVAA